MLLTIAHTITCYTNFNYVPLIREYIPGSPKPRGANAPQNPVPYCLHSICGANFDIRVSNDTRSTHAAKKTLLTISVSRLWGLQQLWHSNNCTSYCLVMCNSFTCLTLIRKILLSAIGHIYNIRYTVMPGK